MLQQQLHCLNLSSCQSSAFHRKGAHCSCALCQSFSFFASQPCFISRSNPIEFVTQILVRRKWLFASVLEWLKGNGSHIITNEPRMGLNTVLFEDGLGVLKAAQ